MPLNRKSFLKRAATLAMAPVALGVASERVAAAELTTLDVAYAGSMSSLMEGPIKALAAERFGVALQGRAQGASGLAALIVGGSIAPDVFISVTPGPIETVLRAGKITLATPIARTEMVIAYTPKGAFAKQFDAAGKRGAEPWWRVLEEPGVRFGRTDPLTDPQGRNIIFTMQLAGSLYREPDLATRVLGPDINPSQIFTEPTVEARLQSGELDAASAYKIQPTAFGLPYVRLPGEINLSDDRRQSDYAKASLTLDGKTYRPQPLVYYAAVLASAAHPTEAHAFVTWLGGPEAQAVFHRFGYDAAGEASPIHA